MNMFIRTLYETLTTKKKYHIKRQQLTTDIDFTRKTHQQHIYTQKLVTQNLRVRRTQLIEEPGHTHIIRKPHIEKTSCQTSTINH